MLPLLARTSWQEFVAIFHILQGGAFNKVEYLIRARRADGNVL